MAMKAKVKASIKRGLERGLRPYGYCLFKVANRYGVDVVSDVSRLSRHWNIDMALAFDVGANIGASSLAFRDAWPACEVVAFEPNPAVARQLIANVAAVGGVSVEQRALSAERGRADFFIQDGDSALSSLKESTPYTERFGLKGTSIEVPVTTLDDVCRERSIQRVNLLKIDSEGSDYDILLGAKDLLAERRIDFIYCEFNSLSTKTGRVGSLTPIIELLSPLSYNFVASYNDYIVAEDDFFSVSNALFAADRGRS